jgi:hypothetical protein
MSEKQNEIPLSKKGQREVSSFVGHELLYDYISNKLDDERRKAVEEHLKFSRDAQLDLSKIQSGQTYAERLSQTVVSEHVIEQINAPSTYLTVLLQKSNFEKWPVGLKWGLEALVVVSVIVVLLTVAPWEKVMKIGVSPASKEVILAEVTKEKTDSEVVKKAEQATPKFADEETTAQAAAPSHSPVPVAAKKETPAAKPTPSPQQQQASVKEVVKTEEESPKHQGGGFLYRGTIDITNIEMAGPKITDKITELGGRKAGDVELGWKKTPNSMYYHFTIPEAKYQELTSFLEQYGKVKISKEKHPRVMPDGIIRLIITVDEAKK